MLKFREENKTLSDKITAFDEERKKMQEQVDQAFIQGKRQAVIEAAKLKAKSTAKVST